MSAVPGRSAARQPLTFTICLGGTIDLEAATQLWPDGDGPESPTATDVAGLIKDYGPAWVWLTEWTLSDFLTVEVLGPNGDRARVVW